MTLPGLLATLRAHRAAMSPERRAELDGEWA